jgi:drug/metabolite transporter (DMT)-like permease
VAARWRIVIALAIVYVVWGSTYLAIRVMVRDVPPLLGAGTRFFLAGVIVLAFLSVRGGRPRIRTTWGQLAAAAAIGTLLAAGGNGLVTVAEQDVPSGLAALLVASVPLWVVVYRTLARDRVAGTTLLGVGLGFAGVALLLAPGSDAHEASLTGSLLIVLAAVSWAAGSFASPRVRLPADPFVSTGWQMVLGGGVLLLAGLVAGETADIGAGVGSAESLLSLGYLIVFGSLVAFTAYVWLLQNAPVSQVATYAYVNPVIAVVLGWAILGESFGLLTLVGAAVIVASVAIIVRRESTPAEASPPGSDARAAPEHARPRHGALPRPTGHAVAVRHVRGAVRD